MVSSQDLLKARRIAMRTRASVACSRCKLSKSKCNDYRPCKRCKRSGQQDLCGGRQDIKSFELDEEGASKIACPEDNGSKSSSTNRHHLYGDYKHHANARLPFKILNMPQRKETLLSYQKRQLSAHTIDFAQALSRPETGTTFASVLAQSEVTETGLIISNFLRRKRHY